MERFQRLAVLARPRWPWMILLLLASAAGLTLVFTQGLEAHPLAYLIYPLSAYTLVVWLLRLPPLFRRVRSRALRHPLARRYVSDHAFRGGLSLTLSTAINLGFALFKSILGLVFRSPWLGAVGLYYLVLSLLRLTLLRTWRGREVSRQLQIRITRRCGWLLLVLDLALSGMTLQMVRDGQGAHYPGYLIYVAALYAFYAVTMAAISLVRFRRMDSPLLLLSKVISLATALVSILSLQTAMFDSFGGTPDFQRVMNASTGGAVCLLIALLALSLILRAGKPMPDHSGAASSDTIQ